MLSKKNTEEGMDVQLSVKHYYITGSTEIDEWLYFSLNYEVPEQSLKAVKTN